MGPVALHLEHHRLGTLPRREGQTVRGIIQAPGGINLPVGGIGEEFGENFG